MISESEALARLVEYHDHIAVPPVSIEEDVQRGRRRVRRTRALVVGATTLAVAVVAAAAVLTGPRTQGRPEPAAPTSTTRPSPSATPLPATSPQSLAPLRPVPAHAAGPPLLPEGTNGWMDPHDVELGAVDIDRLDLGRFGGNSRIDWLLHLRSETTLPAPSGRVIEYGVVLDSDGDGTPDCQIGVTDDPAKADGSGRFRSWVTNLRNGVTEAETGPYGRLIDFVHPQENRSSPGERPTYDPEMRFFFLGSNTGPCNGYGSDSLVYAWAAVGTAGRLVEVDYAPDAAWMRMPG